MHEKSPPQSNEALRRGLLFGLIYREGLLRVLLTRSGIAAQLPQELHPLQAPQPAQLPPQESFPAFLSRIMLRIIRPTVSAMTATRKILMRLAHSHVNTESHPYRGTAAL